MIPNVAVILAGGKGSRFGADRPKQFLEVAGKMVLEHTVQAFENHSRIQETVIVCHAGYLEEMRRIVEKNGWKKVKHVLAGGKERYDSSLAAIRAYQGKEVNLLFHDAVRPLVSTRIIDDVCKALEEHEAVDVIVPAIDTIVENRGNRLKMLDRSLLHRVQTPQGFRLALIEQAYRLALADPAFQATDDCGVVLKYMPEVPVFLVRGEESNVKLTYKEDVYLLEQLFLKREKERPDMTEHAVLSEKGNPGEKPAALVDVAVLILFFNRPDNLEKVFEAVRQSRPSRLFLYQDGPRNEKDIPAIEACRKVVENIDWQCEVHRNYRKENSGCDPSGYNAQSWAFSLADKCVILEDDCVPSATFLSFCKEMLDRYENDNRIGMIAGFNPEEHTEDIQDASYFFTTNFSIWGWASWRRVHDEWDASYSFLDREETVGKLKNLERERKLRKDFLPMCRAHRASGKAFFETIFHSALLLNSQLSIVPKDNMVNNVGLTDNSTHYAGSLCTTPRGLRRIFTMKRHDICDIRHPREVMEHVAYRQRVYRIMAWGHPWIKMGRSVEELWLNIRHGQLKNILKALGNRLRIIFCGRRFK